MRLSNLCVSQSIRRLNTWPSSRGMDSAEALIWPPLPRLESVGALSWPSPRGMASAEALIWPPSLLLASVGHFLGLHPAAWGAPRCFFGPRPAKAQSNRPGLRATIMVGRLRSLAPIRHRSRAVEDDFYLSRFDAGEEAGDGHFGGSHHGGAFA